MTDREKVINGLECCLALEDNYCDNCPYSLNEWECDKWQLKEDALALLKAQEPITGETSDGYHTFNELYHHRAVLFSVIVANYKDRAWKSVRHHDGTMYDGMFIVGIDTPDGQATYHYDINPYWDMFDCKVREFAPKWDGHTPAQAIERIGKLKAQEARVMALEEVVAWTMTDTMIRNPIFEERRNQDGGEWIDPFDDYDTADFVGYGNDVRCWTSRPTNEQMEKVKWDD